jgi:hypothetical protein
VLKQGIVTGKEMTDEERNFLRITSSKQRGCIRFGAPVLDHTRAYLVRITTRHNTGRPLMFSLINDTAKHVEIETLLQETVISQSSSSANWQTNYFILPPLAGDGQGYSVYITNDAIGTQETINDIDDIIFYAFPYDMLTYTTTGMTSIYTDTNSQNTLHVTHPNPAHYTVRVPNVTMTQTLILSQAYNTNWKAYDVTNLTPFKRMLPTIFGTELSNHYTVNNWENGWELPSTIIHTSENSLRSNRTPQRTPTNVENTERYIVILYMPQFLQYIGFVLGITVILYVLRVR